MGILRAERSIKVSPQEHREADHAIDSRFLERWSPRAMTGESIPEEELLRLFEAARWAPSSYNRQPWRFLYARRDTEHWRRFFELLGNFNREWASKAAALIAVISRRTRGDDRKPVRTHAFDAGAAWENLALQGSSMGLVVHAMEGFDHEKARRELSIPNEFAVQAMIAVGLAGDVEELPEDLREREVPSDRKPLSEIVIEGPFDGRA